MYRYALNKTSTVDSKNVWLLSVFKGNLFLYTYGFDTFKKAVDYIERNNMECLN